MTLTTALPLLFAAAGLALSQTPAQVEYKPLTNPERWRFFLEDTVASPTFYTAALVGGLVSQDRNEPPEWHQGVGGYARRAGSSLATLSMQEAIHQGLGAAAGYDPRYLRCDCRGFFRRTGHALKWTLLTKNNAGQTRLDVPSLAGAYGSGMISTYWYPGRFNPLTDGVRTGNQQAAILGGVNILKEFTPDLKRIFKR